MNDPLVRPSTSFLIPIDYDTGDQRDFEILSGYFKAIGRDVRIYAGARFADPMLVSIGDSTIIDSGVMVLGKGRVDIGSFSHLAFGTVLSGRGNITIGDFVGISGGVRVYSSNEDYVDGGSLTSPAVPDEWHTPEVGEVHFGNHSLVGANSVVLPNAHFGEGSVVGALSLVMSPRPEWSLSVGTPARRLRDRPREKILALEADLRAQLYRGGAYVSRRERKANG